MERLKRVGRPAMRVRIVGPSRVSYIVGIAISMRANPGVKTGNNWMRNMSTRPRHRSRVDHPYKLLLFLIRRGTNEGDTRISRFMLWCMSMV